MSVERVALRQQRDLGQIVEAAFSLYLQNFWRFFSMAAVQEPCLRGRDNRYWYGTGKSVDH